MSTALKPIETVYKGYRFRSRLEARWAVFFDALGVRWEYEKEGYDLGPAGWYLPDFWLSKQHCWFEVKAEWPSAYEQQRAQALADASKLSVYVAMGTPTPCDDVLRGDSSWAHRILHFLPETVCIEQQLTTRAWNPKDDVPWDDDCWWGKCIECGRVGIGLLGYVPEHSSECSRPGHDQQSEQLIRAYAAARGARFEYGQRPG